MKVKFKQKWRFAERGIDVRAYEKGKAYGPGEISEQGARLAIELKVATEVLSTRKRD
jgi:hypothetical protein